MGILKDFEKGLESLFEGVLLRGFKSGVHPVELGKKMIRELEGKKVIGVERVYVPNRYKVGLSSADYERFDSYQVPLATELENLVVNYIKEKSYAVVDRPKVSFSRDDRLHEGEFWIKCEMEGDVSPIRAGGKARGRSAPKKISAEIELLDSGEAIPLISMRGETLSIGRSPENDVVIPDPNASRYHARIEVKGDHFSIRDLDSTNGTWVNEARVKEAELADGDLIRLGTTRLIFRRAD
ncbi:MAG: DUF3662 and FHA domain-containing protein [Actinomycetota bacterium]|nr:DUF3662 and FHA domain-containing protein [Actinomycetota bacterium]